MSQDLDLLSALERAFVIDDKAPRTREGYRYSLLRFRRFGIATLADASPELVADYIAWRMANGGRECTRVDVAALCSAVRYLESSHQASKEQLAALRALRPRVKKPRQFRAPYLTRDLFERLCDGARMRDRASRRQGAVDAEFLVRLATLSGLRAGELARLPWSCVDFDRQVIEVKLAPELGPRGRIKNMQERRVPLCQELRKILEQRHERTGYLFRHGVRAFKNSHATVRTLSRELVFSRQNADMPKVTFHLLRHTRASWWIQGGGPNGRRASLEQVALWLGDTWEVVATYYAGLLQGYDPDCEAAPAA